MSDADALSIADDLAANLAAGDAAILALRDALAGIRDGGTRLASLRPSSAMVLSDFYSRIPVMLATALSVAGFDIKGRSAFCLRDINGWPDAAEQSMAAVLPQDFLRKIATAPVDAYSEAERVRRDEQAKANDARNAAVNFGRSQDKTTQNGTQ